jgi:nicotinate-nucleotide adenylyltransferase
MGRERRIGIFGGSFDPVHCGHIELAKAALRELRLDKVYFVPARQPPHKKKRRLSPAGDRLRMLALAIKPFPSFVISRFEIGRRTTTYTYQTLQYFKQRFPAASLYFIIGSDSLAELDTWRKAPLLRTLCTFVTGVRPGAPLPDVTASWRSVHLLAGAIQDVSSSAIRERAADGRSLRTLVPPAVARYIAQKGLYRQ